MDELLLGLTKYFAFYNGERPHQALDYKTPDEVYQSESGGGAMIVNKFSEEEEKSVLQQNLWVCLWGDGRKCA